jgi:hypothetical protein
VICLWVVIRSPSVLDNMAHYACPCVFIYRFGSKVADNFFFHANSFYIMIITFLEILVDIIFIIRESGELAYRLWW